MLKICSLLFGLYELQRSEMSMSIPLLCSICSFPLSYVWFPENTKERKKM